MTVGCCRVPNRAHMQRLARTKPMFLLLKSLPNSKKARLVPSPTAAGTAAHESTAHGVFRRQERMRACAHCCSSTSTGR